MQVIVPCRVVLGNFQGKLFYGLAMIYNYYKYLLVNNLDVLGSHILRLHYIQELQHFM